MLGEHPDIAALLRWDTGAEVTEEDFARLRAHPRYAEAVRGFARNMLAEGDADKALDGLLKDAGRNVAALCATCLHYSPGGLTLPRLRALCASFGIVRPGQARGLLLYLICLRYVQALPRREGDRPARYALTARFIHTWRRHQRAVLDAVRILEPAVELVLNQFEAPGVFEALVKHQGVLFQEAASQADKDMPYIRVFFRPRAGIQTVHLLLAESAGDVFPPVQPIPFSPSAAAQRFGVSHTHMRRLLAAAQAEGLLSRDEDGGAVLWAPAGREALDYIFGSQMIRFLAAAARTLQERPDLAAFAYPPVRFSYRC